MTVFQKSGSTQLEVKHNEKYHLTYGVTLEVIFGNPTLTVSGAGSAGWVGEDKLQLIEGLDQWEKKKW